MGEKVANNDSRAVQVRVDYETLDGIKLFMLKDNRRTLGNACETLIKKGLESVGIVDYQQVMNN